MNVLLLAWACGGQAPPPPLMERPPRHVVAVEAPAPAISRVDLPIVVPGRALDARVASQVPQVLLETDDEPIGRGLVASIRAVRDGPPEVRTDGDGVHVTIPIDLDVRPRPVRVSAKRPPIGTVDGRLAITAHVVPEVTADWAFVPHATLTHEWLETPVLTVGPVQFDVQRMVNAKLVERLALVAAELDTELARDVGLRDKVAEAGG